MSGCGERTSQLGRPTDFVYADDGWSTQPLHRGLSPIYQQARLAYLEVQSGASDPVPYQESGGARDPARGGQGSLENRFTNPRRCVVSGTSVHGRLRLTSDARTTTTQTDGVKTVAVRIRRAGSGDGPDGSSRVGEWRK